MTDWRNQPDAYSINQGDAYSINQGDAYSINQGDAYSINQGDAHGGQVTITAGKVEPEPDPWRVARWRRSRIGVLHARYLRRGVAVGRVIAGLGPIRENRPV